MNKRNVLGGFIALIGAVLGLWLNYKFFLEQYTFMMDVYQQSIDLGFPDIGCQTIVKFFYPLMTDIGILSGTLWAISAYGFFGEKKWAYPLATIANVLALFANMWLNIPPLSTGNPGPWFIIFVPNLLMYLVLHAFVGKLQWKRYSLGMLMGMAYILTFVNSIAATNRLLMRENNTIFILTQRLNMYASIAWFFTVITLLLTKKDWVRYVGIGAGIMSVIAGFPLAIASEGFAFSMFYLGPTVSLVLLVMLFWPDLWDKITTPKEIEQEADPKIQ